MKPLRLVMFLVLPMAFAACGQGYDANQRDDHVGLGDRQDDNPVTPAPAETPARTAPDGTAARNDALDQGRYDQDKNSNPYNAQRYDENTRPSASQRPPSAGETAQVTPFDQGEDASDVRITADIRRSIMTDKSMSMDAQNAKIITNNGVTTLRGQVDSEAEKQAIEAKAKAVNGVVRVDDQLEVKPDRTDKRVD